MKKQAFLVIGLFLIFVFFHFSQTKKTVITLTPSVENNILQIQKINVSAPIIYSNSIDEGIVQKHLESGVVHLPDSALPGEIGNVYIVGHSSDYAFSQGQYKTVFKELEKLEKDNEIVINFKSKEFKYLVFDKKIIEANDFSVLSQETQGRRLLTLQTSYPINTSQKRLVILAELVEF